MLAQLCGKPITLMGVARSDEERPRVDESLKASQKMLKNMGIKTEGLIADIGDPVDRIVKTGKSYDMITVSDSGKSFLKRFFVGSVAFDVMGSANRSVLNVR